MSWPARHIARFIDRAPKEVSAFLGDPLNLPMWASGLSAGIHEEAGAWVCDSPMGKVAVRFAPKNDFGVHDHDVTLPDGQAFHNPLRVLKNDRGSEVVFTLYRREGVDDEALEKDAATITTDLEKLRSILESR